MATYYASPTGSGTVCSLGSPCKPETAVGKATVSGDEIVLLGGIYTYVNGSMLDSAVIQANNVLIRSADDDPASVVLDFNDSADAGGWLTAAAKSGITVRSLTIRDLVAPQAFNFTDVGGGGCSDFLLERIVAEDISQKLVAFKNGTGNTVSRCHIRGQRIATFGSAHAATLWENASGEVSNCIIEPSTLYRPNSLAYLTAVDVNDRIDFYYNVIAGTNNAPIYFNGAASSDVKNNLWLGNGMESTLGSLLVSGQCVNVVVNNNCSLPNGFGSNREYDTEITPGAAEVNVLPRIKVYPRTGYATIWIDDSSAVTATGIDRMRQTLNAQGLHGGWAMYPAEWLSLYAATSAYVAKLVDWLADGHSVAAHGFAANDFLGASYIANGIQIRYTGGGSKGYQITSTASFGSTISGWTGQLVLDPAGAALSKDFTTESTFAGTQVKTLLNLADLVAWINAQAGWEAQLYTGQSGGQLAFSLAHMAAPATATSTFGNVAKGRSVHCWIEVAYSKAVLEQILQEATGQVHSVISWASQGNEITDEAMDALLAAGYKSARGQDSYKLASNIDTANLARFCLQPSAIAILVDGNGTFSAAEQIKCEGVAQYCCSVGAVLCLVTHTANWDSDAKANEIGAALAAMRVVSQLQVVSPDGFGDLVATWTVSAGAGDGSAERVADTHTGLADYTLMPVSPCLDAAVAIAGIAVDFVGTSRPVACAADIGAVEAPWQGKFSLSGPRLPRGNWSVYADAGLTTPADAYGADGQIIPQPISSAGGLAFWHTDRQVYVTTEIKGGQVSVW